jgi:cell division transport system permease protein
LLTVRQYRGRGSAVFLVSILLTISLFIIANHIKLATFTTKEEIAIMKMCGAHQLFIRWPFVFEGMILGLWGGAGVSVSMGDLTPSFTTPLSVSGGLSLITLIPFGTIAARILKIFAERRFVYWYIGFFAGHSEVFCSVV